MKQRKRSQKNLQNRLFFMDFYFRTRAYGMRKKSLQNDQKRTTEKGPKSFKNPSKVPIICFKIKNPPPVELCWRKKEIPRISFIFWVGPTSRQNFTENC
jgi:hypothetical protein